MNLIPRFHHRPIVDRKCMCVCAERNYSVHVRRCVINPWPCLHWCRRTTNTCTVLKTRKQFWGSFSTAFLCKVQFGLKILYSSPSYCREASELKSSERNNPDFLCIKHCPGEFCNIFRIGHIAGLWTCQSRSIVNQAYLDAYAFKSTRYSLWILVSYSNKELS